MASAEHSEGFECLPADAQSVETELSQHAPLTFAVGQHADHSPWRSPPTLLPYDLPQRKEAEEPQCKTETCDAPTKRAPKRRETEARRYNGKEPVAEYLLQFELTARRNGWTDHEKATSLLCALDGPARSLLAEIDDIDDISYATVKNLLTKRFGPISLPDVHEQALQDLRIARGQPIREVTTEVSRLIKLAYPEFDAAARERLAVKALITATNDKETMFYIREKDPKTMEEVCALYERYKVLTGHAPVHRPAVVKATKPEDATEPPINNATVSALLKQAEVHGKQLADLTEAVGRLVQQQYQQLQQPPPVQMTPAQLCYPAATPHAVPPQPGPQQNPATATHGQQFTHRHAQGQDRPIVPRKPCPKCDQPGHWARDCPQAPPTQPATCFRCGMPGHMRRDCNVHLNPTGSTAAPAVGPMIHRQQ